MDDRAAADLLGSGGVWRDPLWGLEVRLTPLERDLLRSWWVRRLAWIAHAGAAAWTTTQSYSRLEHSLGVLALTARFRPGDAAARAAALLHDIGHLPLSHTFEGVAGLDHHVLGRRRMEDLAPLLAVHGIDAAALDAAWSSGSARRRADGLLGVDHLDSFVRSGRAHGRLHADPAALLQRLRLVDGVVDTDAATAAVLAELAVGEAASQLAAANVAAVAVGRRIAAPLVQDDAGRHRVTAATDAEFWALALADPRSAQLAEDFRRRPDGFVVRRSPPGAAVPAGAMPYRKDRLYAAVPTVDGVPGAPLPLPEPPIDFLVERR